MNKAAIATLIAYNFWANERILAACERLTTEEFSRTVVPDPGWGSLRATLVHALDTEYGWRSVLQALDASEILEVDDFADVATLKARWQGEREAWLHFADSLNEEELNARYGTDSQQGPKVWQTIVHVVNHGTQHRSEAATILTGYGQSPGEMDFDLFLEQNPASM
ncbi:MAG: DinB family protein [Chloroflexaceae bacterium]|jgi:uncharacterized damage-inducible protein DinB|nr:DinB family protein [Chloroflexaceae bacterium]